MNCAGPLAPGRRNGSRRAVSESVLRLQLSGQDRRRDARTQPARPQQPRYELGWDEPGGEYADGAVGGAGHQIYHGRTRRRAFVQQRSGVDGPAVEAPAFPQLEMEMRSARLAVGTDVGDVLTRSHLVAGANQHTVGIHVAVDGGDDPPRACRGVDDDPLAESAGGTGRRDGAVECGEDVGSEVSCQVDALMEAAVAGAERGGGDHERAVRDRQSIRRARATPGVGERGAGCPHNATVRTITSRADSVRVQNAVSWHGSRRHLVGSVASDVWAQLSPGLFARGRAAGRIGTFGRKLCPRSPSRPLECPECRSRSGTALRDTASRAGRRATIDPRS